MCADPNKIALLLRTAAYNSLQTEDHSFDCSEQRRDFLRLEAQIARILMERVRYLSSSSLADVTWSLGTLRVNFAATHEMMEFTGTLLELLVAHNETLSPRDLSKVSVLSP